MFLKIVISILTLLTVLAMLGFAVWGFFLHQPILVVVAGLLFLGFGYFSYNDARYWIHYFSTKK